MPGRRRDLVRQVQAANGVSEARSCVALGVDRSTIRYRSTKPDQAPNASTTVKARSTREALAIEVDQGIRGEQVVTVMRRLALVRGAPKAIKVDNGPEFVSKALDRWAYQNGVTLDFSRPGKPTDNAFVESFNGRLRDECLNAH
jgi:putative transposase